MLSDKAWRIAKNQHERDRRRWVGSRPRAVHALDIGCGQGNMTSAIHADSLTVCDIDPAQLVIAGLVLADHGVDASLCVADIYDLPFPDATFDAVYCLETLEHLDSPARAVREIERVCCGTIYVTVPAHGHMTHTTGHVQDFTEESLSAMFDNVVMCETREPFIYLVSLSQGAAPSGNRGGTPGVLE